MSMGMQPIGRRCDGCDQRAERLEYAAVDGHPAHLCPDCLRGHIANAVPFIGAKGGEGGYRSESLFVEEEVARFVIYRTDGCFYHPGALVPWSKKSPPTSYKLAAEARRKARELRSLGHACDVEERIERVGTRQMEEPTPCPHCGEVVELQSMRYCWRCRDTICPECQAHRGWLEPGEVLRICTSCRQEEDHAADTR